MRERSGLDWLKTILSIPPELGLEERESALWGEEGVAVVTKSQAKPIGYTGAAVNWESA